MKITICVITICVILFAGAVELKTQSLNGAVTPDLKEAVEKAKEKILQSDIGKETEMWINSIKDNNIKLKMIFDEDGFVLMVNSLRLGKRLVNERGALTYDDSILLIEMLNAAEKFGAPLSSNLKEKIFQRINNSVNKKWDAIIRSLCGYAE